MYLYVYVYRFKNPQIRMNWYLGNSWERMFKIVFCNYGLGKRMNLNFDNSMISIFLWIIILLYLLKLMQFMLLYIYISNFIIFALFGFVFCFVLFCIFISFLQQKSISNIFITICDNGLSFYYPISFDKSKRERETERQEVE